jgi:signal transduction histidine kinase
LVETERIAPRSDSTMILTDTEAAVGRLEATIEELLSLTRNRPTDRVELDIDGLFRDLDERWRRAYDAVGRVLHIGSVTVDSTPTVVASRSAIGHILDVLVDNALRHGKGTTTVSWERVAGGVAIRVADGGALGDVDSERLFARRGRDVSAGVAGGGRRGIGLSLARRLAQAEGGDLVCSSPAPTTFSVLLPAV